MLSWSFETKRDLQEAIEATKETLADSRALIVEANRVLARR
jgi:hypothetical protein